MGEYVCVSCGLRCEGKMYGAGDGTGQRFRCVECHWRAEVERLEREQAEVARLRAEVDRQHTLYVEAAEDAAQGKREVERLGRERDEARESLTRMQRRAQAAEGALINPGSADPSARTLGRMLANTAAGIYLRRAEAAEKERDALLGKVTGRDRLFDAEAWDGAMDALGKEHEAREAAEARAARLAAGLQRITKQWAMHEEEGDTPCCELDPDSPDGWCACCIAVRALSEGANANEEG
jgi:hypothetical protein